MCLILKINLFHSFRNALSEFIPRSNNKNLCKYCLNSCRLLLVYNYCVSVTSVHTSDSVNPTVYTQFLAAMSSSRSDVVTLSVRRFVRSSVCLSVRSSVRPSETLFFFSPKRSYGALQSPQPYQLHFNFILKPTYPLLLAIPFPT